jgi:hypothetical protein
VEGEGEGVSGQGYGEAVVVGWTSVHERERCGTERPERTRQGLRYSVGGHQFVLCFYFCLAPSVSACVCGSHSRLHPEIELHPRLASNTPYLSPSGSPQPQSTSWSTKVPKTSIIKNKNPSSLNHSKYQTWANGVPTESAFVIPPKADK